MKNHFSLPMHSLQQTTRDFFGRRKRRFFLPMLLLLACGSGAYRFVSVQAGFGISDGNRQASLSDRVVIHGSKSPALNLSDGRELLTAFAGNLQAQQALDRGLVRPLSMATADFDEDGVADLVAGYAGAGGGIISLHRGNLDALYPNSAYAGQRQAEGNRHRP
jgi:hypothetical protein